MSAVQTSGADTELSKIPIQNQIHNWDSDLILNKTKSITVTKTKTNIWP